MIHGLTPRMRDTLVFIETYQSYHGHAPSFRDIAKGIGVASTANIHRLVHSLIERNAISMLPARARSIKVRPAA